MDDIKPNFDELASRSYLSIEEIAFMMCDINPDLNEVGGYTAFGPTLDDGGLFIGARLSKQLSLDRIKMIEEVYGKITSAGWNIKTICPKDLVAMAEVSGIKLPIKFTNFVNNLYKNHKLDSNSVERVTETSSLGCSSQETRKMNSYLKIIAVLGCAGYGIKDLLESNKFVQEIKKDGEKMGIELSKDTILKILREANALISKS